MIVVSELMWEEGLDVLRAHAPTIYDPQLGDDPPALARWLAGATALVVRNRTPVDARLLAAAPRLRVVGRLGTGLDNLDLTALRAAGVAVVYAPGANAIATAEFALTLALALAHRLPEAALAGEVGRWDRAGLASSELAGRCLGILGLGRTGLLVARGARALGMEVWAHHPRRLPQDAEARQAGVRLVTFEELLRGVDVLSLHLPLTPETRDLIGLRQLALMRPGALLINTARGGLVDEAALGTALREGWLGGAALDVRAQEPPPVPDPLDGAPRLLRTPHVAGLTGESQKLVSLLVARDVVRVLSDQKPASGGDWSDV